MKEVSSPTIPHCFAAGIEYLGYVESSLTLCHGISRMGLCVDLILSEIYLVTAQMIIYTYGIAVIWPRIKKWTGVDTVIDLTVLSGVRRLRPPSRDWFYELVK